MPVLRRLPFRGRVRHRGVAPAKARPRAGSGRRALPGVLHVRRRLPVQSDHPATGAEIEGKTMNVTLYTSSH